MVCREVGITSRLPPLLAAFSWRITRKCMFEYLGITFEGETDWVALASYFISVWVIAGLWCYGVDTYTYFTYGV